ncbi:MAG TPA: hypothetical protein VGG27_11520 [Magnetospirillaceae bacterium]|jgi:hypothetical protein
MRLATATAWVILPIIAGAGLYFVKMRVESQGQHLVALQKQIVDTRESIHVLKAEWSYLNDPVHLRDEAERLLAMHPVTPRQIVSFDQVPMPDQNPVPGPAASTAPLANPANVHKAAKVAAADDPIAAAIAALNDPPRSKHP